MTDKKIIKITTPLADVAARSLKAGDSVRITGSIFTARDAAHKRMAETLAQGGKLPFDIKGQIIYYVGPSPAKPGQPIGSAGPTTSGRMDKYSPEFMKLGMKGMIGKGLRDQAVVDAIKQYGAVYFAAIGGAAALIAQTVKAYRVVDYADLASEALAEMVVEDFPAIVVIDSEGNDYYKIGVKEYCRE
jgi:fumarate hydratase subunit beta